MARITLKNILSERNESFALVSSLMDELKADVFIEDGSQKILVGKSIPGAIHQQPL
jgi:hypothetical protein